MKNAATTSKTGSKTRAKTLDGIRFEQMSDDIFVAFITKARTDIYGRAFKASEATRAIREAEGWRVDRCGNVAGAWLPWEPIDSRPRPTVVDAMRAIVDYARAPA